MEIVTIVLLLVMQGKAQDVTTDITFSGDGDGSVFTTSYASLIDDNGDIQNISLYDSISSTVLPAMDNETETVLYTTEDQSTSTTKSADTTMAFSDTSYFPRIVPSTTALTTTSTMESSTSTEIPTTTETTKQTTTTTETTEQTTTTTTVKPTTRKPPTTTTTSSIATEKTEPEQIITTKAPKAHEMTTVETTYTSATGGKYCSFMDDNLKCDEEIVCHGEGEIDCTEEAETSHAETTFVDEISLSPVPADYSDDEGAGDVIETFPPHLVGVKSSKQSLPFLFRMGSLETTAMDSDNFEEIQEQATTLTTVTPIRIHDPPIIEGLASEEIYSKLKTTMGNAEIRDSFSKILSVPESIVEPTSISHSVTKLPNTESVQELSEENTSTISYSSTKESSTESIEELPQGNTPSTKSSSTVLSTMQDPVMTVENITSQVMTTFSTEASSDHSVNVRRKREKNVALASESASSMSLSLHMANADSSKRKRPKACKLSGNLVCTPSPTTTRCRGKTLCQVISGSAESSESTKSVESWAIAVIAICAIASALTVSLLVYLIFTSWKKLKVQPQNGVTTLNYVNSSVP